ncbi:phenylalanine--tRNA ligase subunit beta [Jiulongibacter sediminis]|uniref:Phenylalanine--tRNA ligase beta subunit n=1 Tax=Jiulongibacter sediminis TaxID=1605367 RepID=A0A0P7BX48_9BACT|nr:phenylalanine--tRNA ligase subunit beta [Jiulongibacter sediminis]KPM49194.1 phenylalanyl-tRNA synthetase subunit beta [Jiulongibacter sediminis]TBX26248.1 phenylalanyl-tRNA synthetase subunit beta [Jiulongibacter sediminis]
MLISYNALKSLIDFPQNPEELSALLTSTGLEVEGLNEVLPVPGGLAGLVIGEVKTCEPHPNADKLKCTTVDVGGGELLSIVCGAPNVAAGQKVIVATVGTTLYPTEGDSFQIKKSKIRGEVSEGMICAEDEIGLGQSHAGIMVLDTNKPNGTPAADYFNLKTDYCIEIGLTPNRADAASHFGVARDIRAITNKGITLPAVDSFSTGTAENTIKLKVENTEACPRFCGLEIRGVVVKESPQWLKDFLGTIGVNSINNLVDISNYICHYLGQPMHIFDADKIRGQEIIVKAPQKGTKIKTLDGLERELNGNDLAICDAEGPIGIAGVFGGEDSGVTEETTNVFLEVAYFNPDWVRGTATRHSLKTDASFRYERGTDPNMPPYAIKSAALLVKELAGGEFCKELFENYPVEIKNQEVKVKFKNIDRLLGKQLPKGLIIDILQKLDISVEAQTEEGLTLSVPPYRVDVTREADVVEEILRIYGFDNIELSENLSSDYLSDFPKVEPDLQRLKVSELLAGNGFFEVQNLSIVKPSQNAVLGDAEETQVKLLNPLTEDLSVMRNSLLFSGLQTLAYNINRRSKDLKIYEFGRVYGKKVNENGTKYFDKQVLGLWITGNAEAESWQVKSTKATFFDLKNALTKVLAGMKLNGLTTDEAVEARFEYGINYKLNNKIIAVAGKVKSSHLKYSGVKQDVFYAEVDWEYALKKYTPEVSFVEIPKFPAVRRDLSLVLNKEVGFDQIKNVAEQTERKLLTGVNVFDIYEGENLGAGKKSYSVSFTLQDPNKTLNDKAIDKTMSRLIQVFESDLGAEIRR